MPLFSQLKRLCAQRVETSGMGLLKTKNLKSLGFNQLNNKFQIALAVPPAKRVTFLSCILFRFGVVMQIVRDLFSFQRNVCHFNRFWESPEPLESPIWFDPSFLHSWLVTSFQTLVMNSHHFSLCLNTCISSIHTLPSTHKFYGQCFTQESWFGNNCFYLTVCIT